MTIYEEAKRIAKTRGWQFLQPTPLMFQEMDYAKRRSRSGRADSVGKGFDGNVYGSYTRPRVGSN